MKKNKVSKRKARVSSINDNEKLKKLHSQLNNEVTSGSFISSVRPPSLPLAIDVDNGDNAGSNSVDNLDDIFDDVDDIDDNNEDGFDDVADNNSDEYEDGPLSLLNEASDSIENHME